MWIAEPMKKWIFIFFVCLAGVSAGYWFTRPAPVEVVSVVANPPAEKPSEASPVAPTSAPVTQPAPSTTQSISSKRSVVAGTQPADAGTAFIQHLDDGSMLVDRLYPLRGAGTEIDPYVLSWVYLLSAKETYQPEAGHWDLPARISMLEGKHVMVRGYLAVPVYSRLATRVLLTWNMIDACHGTRPKPFEALEVTLNKPLEIQPHSLTKLQLSGILKLDVRLQQGWLTTLYRLDDASIEAIEK